MSKRRRLSQDDMELWRRVADKTDALHKREVFDPAEHLPTTKRDPKPRTEPISFDPDKVKSKPEPRTRADLLPGLPERLKGAPVQMDKKVFGRMTRGKLKPEGRIDLHGMTLDHAHGALTSYIMRSHASGKRFVLVITGKGKNRDDGGPIPVRFGILRHQVPQWLSAPPLSSVVQQVSQAHIRHGGGGAYYVYLKRRR